jgi:uroporphyrinogen-III synthase
MIEMEDKLWKAFRAGNGILATKKLSKGQKAALQTGGFALYEYNAIEITYLQAPFPPGFKHLIFSSKNGVKAFLHIFREALSEADKPGIKCYCVGKKTAALLVKNGFTVEISCSNSLALATWISVHSPDQSFLYCCGSRRREELPSLLGEQGVHLKELVVYETTLNPERIDGIFDGVLFFSPSGVESFFQMNDLQHAIACCIGPTTAKAVSKYTNRFIVAPYPDTDALITMIINALYTVNQQPKKTNGEH